MTWESRATYAQFMLTGATFSQFKASDGGAYAVVQPIVPDDSGEWELVGNAPAGFHGMVWYWKRQVGRSRVDEIVEILRDLARDSEGALLVSEMRRR